MSPWTILNDTMLRWKSSQRDKPPRTIFFEFSASNMLQVFDLLFEVDQSYHTKTIFNVIASVA